MFYSHQILAKKGPLGVIWLAAHLDKKLRRQQVFQADIPDSVEAILYATEPRALRLSGQLLLGVARIYAKKVGYLYTDCNDAMLKLRQAYHVGATQVDLAPDAVAAPVGAITLPEHYLDEWEALEGATATPAGSVRQPPRKRGRRDADAAAALDVAASVATTTGFVPLEFNEDDEFNLFGGEQPTMEGLRSRFDDFDDDEPERLRGAESGGAGGVAMEPGSVLDLDEQLLMTPSREPVPPPAEDEDEFLQMPAIDDVPEVPMPEMGNDELATSLPPSADRSLPPVSPQLGADELPGMASPALPASKRKSPDADERDASPKARAPRERVSKRRQLQVDEYLVISKKEMRETLHDTSDIVVERRFPGRKRKTWMRSDDLTKTLTLQPSVEPATAEVKALYERCFQHGGTKKNAAVEGAVAEEEDEREAALAALEVPEMALPDMDVPGVVDEDAFRFDDGIPDPQSAPRTGAEEEEEEEEAHLVPMVTPGSGLHESETGGGATPAQSLREALAVAADDGLANDEVQAAGVNTLSTRSRRVATFMKAEFTGRRASGSRSRARAIELKEVLTEGSTKAEAARMLLEMLTLTTKGFMSIAQDSPYGSIVLEPTREMMTTDAF